jgi:hypothetical protein
MTNPSIARAALLLSFVVSPLAAQQLPATAEPARLMILGTYHFANPGLDVVQNEVADVLAPAKQQEIVRIVDALVAFRPTIVAVEQEPSQARVLDSLYVAFREGRHELSRNEVQQVGFRLAAREDLERVVPIDHSGEFPFQALMGYAGEKDPAAVAWIEQVLAGVQADGARQQRELTIPAILREKNDPARIASEHGIYVRLSEIGAGDGYVGADLLAAWYERNIRIFANIQRIAGPADRVLVIIGSGHLGILRELAAHDPQMRLVEPNDFLPAR